MYRFVRRMIEFGTDQSTSKTKKTRQPEDNPNPQHLKKKKK